MSLKDQLKLSFPYLNVALCEEIGDHAVQKLIPANTEILREGQYVKVIPLLVSGLIKVYTKQDDRELLLYYIQAEESCIMSFSAAISNEPSKIFAITEEETHAILIPVDKIPRWIRQYPDFNTLFYDQYKVRYTELLDTIQHLLFDKLDKRLLDYLEKKVSVTGKTTLQISHRQIANELGTAREVVTRILKKLEIDQRIKQTSNGIEIII